MSSDSQPTAAAGSELRLSGVTLLSPEPRGDGAPPARGLDLDVGDTGLTLTAGDGSSVWSVAWVDVAELMASEQAGPADVRHGGGSDEGDAGGGALVVVTTRGHRSHRMLVPAGQPEKLTAALALLARRHDVGPPDERSLPPLAVAGLLFALGAAVAALLLAAGHVI